jgi:hypothetical protein
MTRSNTASHSLHQYIFLFFLYFSWILYAFSLIIYSDKDFRWLSDAVQQIIKIYVGLVLVIKYNPYVKEQDFTSFDRRLVYNAGMLILLTTVVTKLVERYFQYFKADIRASYIYHYFKNDRKLGA